MKTQAGPTTPNFSTVLPQRAPRRLAYNERQPEKPWRDTQSFQCTSRFLDAFIIVPSEIIENSLVDKGCTATVRDEVKRLKVQLLYYNLVIHFYRLLDGTIEAPLVYVVGFTFLFGHIVWISLASLVETPVLLAHIETGFAC